MSKRTDVHRPSAINPEDYDFVGCECIKIEGFGDAQFLIAERKAIKAHMERTGGTYSRHDHGGNCGICGSVNAIYTALFHHVPTNTYVRAGSECTGKLDGGSLEEFRKNCGDARKNAAGKLKAQAMLNDRGIGRAFEIYAEREGYVSKLAKLNTASDYGKRTAEQTAEIDAVRAILWPSREMPQEKVWSIVKTIVAYGSVSDKQADYLRKLVDRIDNADALAAKRAAEVAAAAPLPQFSGRVTITGTVRSVKQVVGYAYDDVSTKIIVQHADGWKVYGTAPRSIVGDELVVGCEVEFVATVERSDRDEKFGFFRRPTNAKLLKAATA